MTTGLSESATLLSALSTGLADAVEQAGQAVVAVNARRRRSASGVRWRSNLVVTTDHAVNRDEDITVRLADGQTLAATLVGRDSGTDLAVLRLEGAPEVPIEIGDASSLKVGHLVLAIGRSGEGDVNASMGVISALGGTWRTWHGGRIDQFVRPSLMLYPGFSGGPLVNAQGQIVGINTTGPRHSTLTIPAVTVNRVVDQLLGGGRVARGYLGVGMQPVRLPEAQRRSLDLPNAGGVLVVSVEPDSPADQAGVLIGDILIALGGSSIDDIGDVQARLDPEQVGQPLTAQMIRGGVLTEVTIVVGERAGGVG